MSFSSRRLRVRLPCGEQTIVEHDPAKATATAAQACNWVFASPPPGTLGQQAPLARWGCEWPASDVDCTGFNSVDVCTPMLTVPTCGFWSPTNGPACTIMTPACSPDTGIPPECVDSQLADPSTTFVAPEDLAVLRAQLERTLKQVEAQLSDVEAAQEELKKRG